MSMELLLLTPYAAIAASLLLVATVSMTCHMQTAPDQMDGFSDSIAAYTRPTRSARASRSGPIKSRSMGPVLDHGPAAFGSEPRYLLG